jgi:hypothetical protein
MSRDVQMYSFSGSADLHSNYSSRESFSVYLNEICGLAVNVMTATMGIRKETGQPASYYVQCPGE